MIKNYEDKLVERFLNYVKIDTQSDPNSLSNPSTEKQKNLAKILVEELQEMGIKNAKMDEFGYVYAYLASNSNKKSISKIAFCSHLDTSPDCSGKDVKPIIHKNYQGQNLHLPVGEVIIKLEEHIDLKNQIGNDIITASGDTLLGADNKAGVAEIMTAVQILTENPSIIHGEIKIVFTPDEEIGRGTDKIDLEKLDSDFAYTIDGETLGSIENETFSADGVEIIIYGKSAHPGFAKGQMVSSLKIGAEILANLPKKELSPESTQNKEGFIHPTDISGNVEKTRLSFIIRDFETEGLLAKENLLLNITQEICNKYSCSSFEFKVTEQYRNMKEILDKYPSTIENAIEAIKLSDIEPKLQSIRGGTDGSRLSFMGLPCPNIFAGEHAFHSKQEWVSVNDMLKAVEVIINLAKIWEQKS